MTLESDMVKLLALLKHSTKPFMKSFASGTIFLFNESKRLELFFINSSWELLTSSPLDILNKAMLISACSGLENIMFANGILSSFSLMTKADIIKPFGRTTTIIISIFCELILNSKLQSSLCFMSYIRSKRDAFTPLRLILIFLVSNDLNTIHEWFFKISTNSIFSRNSFVSGVTR